MQLVQQLRNATIMVLLLTLLTGFAYPLLVTGVAQLVFPYQANGSLIRDMHGQVIGSELIGQMFTRPEYFHPRPSAAGQGYDATASAGSNLGPTNKKLVDLVAQRAAAYRQANGLPPDAQVPVDAVTASGSGLDPHISVANAYLQIPRVARTRGLPEEYVRALVDRYTEPKLFLIFGESRVNVLKLNLALDAGEQP